MKDIRLYLCDFLISFFWRSRCNPQMRDLEGRIHLGLGKNERFWVRVEITWSWLQQTLKEPDLG